MRLYLFPAALENLLSGGLGALERAWWTDAPEDRVLVLVPERELRLVGPYLAVLGGSHCGEAATLAADGGPGAERPRAMYGLCRETLRWDEPWVERLTPLHLAAAGQAPDGDGIAGALRTHLANACLLYLADRTERLPAAVGVAASTAPGSIASATPGGAASTAPAARLLSTFSGVRNRVPVVAGDPATAQLPATAAEGLASLVRLVEWAYDATWAGDRLPMAQLAFTEALLPVAPEARFAHFVTAAPAVLDGLRWHWKAFIEGRIDGYEAKVRALEDDVAGVVKAFGDQTAEMIKGLSDTMLATIAVVLGAFVAALLSEKFNAQVFVIACSLYLAYVLLFPLLFNMVHQRTRFLDAGRAFAERLQRYGQQLPQERIADIATGQVEASKGRFRTWFVVTVVAYLALSVLLLIGILNTPRLAGMLGAAAAPRATANATATRRRCGAARDGRGSAVWSDSGGSSGTHSQRFGGRAVSVGEPAALRRGKRFQAEVQRPVPS